MKVPVAFAKLFASMVLLVCIGCGPGRGDLSGKVAFQGKSLRFGSVSVLGSDGIAKSSLIGSDGMYQIKDVVAGPIKASVFSPDPGQSQPAQRIPGTPVPKVDRAGWFAIPEKYNDFAKSDLVFDLKSGSNTWDIDLK